MNFAFEVTQTDPTGARRGKFRRRTARSKRRRSCRSARSRHRQRPDARRARSSSARASFSPTPIILYLRPGHDLIRKLGGLHRFMSWTRRDPHRLAAGFRFSVSSRLAQNYRRRRRASVRISTARSICSRPRKPPKFSSRSAPTSRWCSTSASRRPHRATSRKPQCSARRCGRAARGEYFLQEMRNAASAGDRLGSRQWQFGIVQGATFADLRRESAQQLLEIDFPGIRGRRPRGGRTACDDLRDDGVRHRAAPKGSPAISDGRRPPRTNRRLRRARHRHDGLRSARRAPHATPAFTPAKAAC